MTKLKYILEVMPHNSSNSAYSMQILSYANRNHPRKVMIIKLIPALY